MRGQSALLQLVLCSWRQSEPSWPCPGSRAPWSPPCLHHSASLSPRHWSALPHPPSSQISPRTPPSRPGLGFGQRPVPGRGAQPLHPVLGERGERAPAGPLPAPVQAGGAQRASPHQPRQHHPQRQGTRAPAGEGAASGLVASFTPHRNVFLSLSLPLGPFRRVLHQTWMATT